MPRQVRTALVETQTVDGKTFFLADSYGVCRCDCPEFHLHIWLKDKAGHPFALATVGLEAAAEVAAVITELVRQENMMAGRPGAFLS